MAYDLARPTLEQQSERLTPEQRRGQLLDTLFGAELAKQIAVHGIDEKIWTEAHPRILQLISGTHQVRSDIETYLTMVPAEDLWAQRFTILLRQIDDRAATIAQQRSEKGQPPLAEAATAQPDTAGAKAADAPPSVPAQKSDGSMADYANKVRGMNFGDLMMEIAQGGMGLATAVKGLGGVIEKAMGMATNRFDKDKLAEAKRAFATRKPDQKDPDVETKYEADQSAACVLSTLGLKITEGGATPDSADALLQAFQNSQLVLQKGWEANKARVVPGDVLFFSRTKDGKEQVYLTAVVTAIKPVIQMKTVPPEGGQAVIMAVEDSDFFKNTTFHGLIHLPDEAVAPPTSGGVAIG